MNSNCFFILFLFSVHFEIVLSDCSGYLLTTAISLEEINGKCIAVTKTTPSGSVASTCRIISKNSTAYTWTYLSIDSKAENDHVKNGLEMRNIQYAYIGYSQSSSGWGWMNNDTSNYNNWANPPVTQPPTIGPTTVPFRSTLPPSEQRRSTAVVVGVDASLFSTISFTFAQVDFITSLSNYIAVRGPSEFAFFAYGCTQTSPYIYQYPNFVSSFEDTTKMILTLNETINQNCVRSSPLDFKSMFRDQTVYYNRYSTSYRPFKSKFISMIYFTSSTDAVNVQGAVSLYPIANSSVIMVMVGDNAIDASRVSIPSGKYGIRIKTPDDIRNLVPKIDSIIFGQAPSSVAGVKMDAMEYDGWGFEMENAEYPIYAASDYTDCAYMNSETGLWYSDGTCATKRQVLCQYILPVPEQPPTPNPTIMWSDPCYYDDTKFTYFEVLSNAKCYRLSTSKKQFAQAEDTCITDHPLFLHTPKLTSIESLAEEEQLKTLIATIPSEGMFWFGLKRDPANSTNWYFINGDVYDASYSNWRDGYPRDADGCDCVAFVVNDNSWVNTYCNKPLYSICSFRFNVTDTTIKPI
uniref:C-type lectin domain-containing protein n=1 Tax=Caenorhabditis tropicalis TaxID=1561998 RepID=A0A1I7TYJ2_9PELO